MKKENVKLRDCVQESKSELSLYQKETGLVTCLASKNGQLFSLIDKVDKISQQVNKKEIDSKTFKYLFGFNNDDSYKKEIIRISSKENLLSELDFKIKQVNSVKRALLIKMGEMQSRSIGRINF